MARGDGGSDLHGTVKDSLVRRSIGIVAHAYEVYRALIPHGSLTLTAWRPHSMTHTSTDQPARRPSGAIVPVLAFAGIVVAVMQTLLVPVIKDLPQLLST